MSVTTHYNYQVKHTINYKLFDKIYDVACTYKIELEKLENYNFRIILTRSNFKLNDKKIEAKFEKIAHAYNDALFPIVFDVNEGNFALANYNEISKRLELKDAALQLKHEGPGFDFIREDFLQKVAKDGYAMAEYIYSFGLIKIILLCLGKTENNNNYEFHWQAYPLEYNLFWKGKKTFDTESNILQYEAEGNHNDQLFQHIKTAANAYQYPDTVTDKESVITTAIEHKTQFRTRQLDLEFSETSIGIRNTYFHYQENFFITAYNKTEDRDE